MRGVEPAAINLPKCNNRKQGLCAIAQALYTKLVNLRREMAHSADKSTAIFPNFVLIELANQQPRTMRGHQTKGSALANCMGFYLPFRLY